MIIQLNADNNLSIHDDFAGTIDNLLLEKLKRFSKHISRLEVHFSDENASKQGVSDKRCMLEARIEGKEPIAVTNEGETYEHALHGAIEKLKASLNTIIGKMEAHQ